MNDFERVIRYNSLLLIYKELLSNTQKEVLTDYFDFNLSISEIAESRNISRAAVEDAIKKGQKKLDEYEEKLKILERNKQILELVNKFKNASSCEDRKGIIDEIERIVK